MNKEDIIRMAREAGPLISTPFDVWCERFAALVAAHEREERDRLKKALQWALNNGISANDWGSRKPYTFNNKGCGCCSYEEDVPEDIAAVVNEAACVVVEKQNEPR